MQGGPVGNGDSGEDEKVLFWADENCGNNVLEDVLGRVFETPGKLRFAHVEVSVS